MGPLFLTETTFSGFRMEKTKNCEEWACILRQILKNRYLSLSNWPLKMCRGFEARAAHPVQTKSVYPRNMSFGQIVSIFVVLHLFCCFFGSLIALPCFYFILFLLFFSFLYSLIYFPHHPDIKTYLLHLGVYIHWHNWKCLNAQLELKMLWLFLDEAPGTKNKIRTKKKLKIKSKINK